jgi:hypothetical protein
MTVKQRKDGASKWFTFYDEINKTWIHVNMHQVELIQAEIIIDETQNHNSSEFVDNYRVYIYLHKNICTFKLTNKQYEELYKSHFET